MVNTKNVNDEPHNHVIMRHSELCSKRGGQQSPGGVSDAWLLWPIRPAWTILGIAKDIQRCMTSSLEAIKHICQGPNLASEGFQMTPNVFRSEVSRHRSSDVTLSAPKPYTLPEELSNHIKLPLQLVRHFSTCRGQARPAYRTALGERVLSTQRSLAQRLKRSQPSERRMTNALLAMARAAMMVINPPMGNWLPHRATSDAC